MVRNLTNDSESPVKGRRSPSRRGPSRRERSPVRHRSSHPTSSPPREKPSSRTKATHRETGSDREDSSERRERSSGRDAAVDRGSSRSKHGRSASASDHHHKGTNSIEDEQRAREDEQRHLLEIAYQILDISLASPVELLGSNGDDDSVAKMKAAEEALEVKEKQKPSFELSGKLAVETNRVRVVTLLFTEPPDAWKPDIRWRLYVFKGGEVLNEPLYIHRQSCYLFRSERRVADIRTDHPSCSKQHAVLQYRQVGKEQAYGTLSKQVRPYLMDLGSTNGTFLNDNRIHLERYYELFEKDSIKFGNTGSMCYYTRTQLDDNISWLLQFGFLLSVCESFINIIFVHRH
ncbi:FHA domain-containing protein DDL-like [Cornus florida]|uniref:FHA domain-containing protein DDL-like n=1 Tax=Cornus florida TaxID=4283 RepID=UPI002898B0FA|nr:FHA domain-containing protein DDL-like [Cornus florida]